MYFKMSSAICLSLDHSEFLSSCNGLKHFVEKYDSEDGKIVNRRESGIMFTMIVYCNDL